MGEKKILAKSIAFQKERKKFVKYFYPTCLCTTFVSFL